MPGKPSHGRPRGAREESVAFMRAPLALPAHFCKD